MSMIKEFKSFAMKGNVLDMAVGIIIGVAFGGIISSLVKDMIMPPIGLLLGGVDFSALALVLKEAQGDTPAVTIGYGVFINTIINFVIITFAIFMLIQVVNKFKRQREAAPEAPTTKECPECAMSIPISAKRCGHCTSVVVK